MPSPSRSEYLRRHHSHKDREPHYRNRDQHPDDYRDLDRPSEDPYYQRSRSPLGKDRDRERERDRDKYDRRERRSRSPYGGRDRGRDRDRRDRRRTPERSSRYRSRSRS